MSWNYPQDLTEAAWGLIANAFEGNWDKAPAEWREAAEAWRDAYHEALSSGKSLEVQKGTLPHES